MATEALRLWDEERGDWFLPPAESEADYLRQTRRADREAQRATQEVRRANQEVRRADREAQARAELEQEVARLRAQLKEFSESEES